MIPYISLAQCCRIPELLISATWLGSILWLDRFGFTFGLPFSP